MEKANFTITHYRFKAVSETSYFIIYQEKLFANTPSI